MASSNRWEEAVKQLKPEAQRRVQAWVGTQNFIARELGMTQEQWSTYLEWAFQNPLDYSFAAQDTGSELARMQGVLPMEEDRSARLLGKERVASVGALTQGKAPAAGPGRKVGLSNFQTLSEGLPKKKKH